MLSVEEISSHVEIRQVLATYARAVDRWDAELLKTCYHEDATDSHTMFNGSGWAFADWVVTMCTEVAGVTQHHITNVHIALECDRANVESYYLAYHQYPDETGVERMFVSGGRYLDRFARREGVWRIAKRICTMDWSQEPFAIQKWEGAKAFPRIGPKGVDPMYALFAEA